MEATSFGLERGGGAQRSRPSDKPKDTADSVIKLLKKLLHRIQKTPLLHFIQSF